MEMDCEFCYLLSLVSHYPEGSPQREAIELKIRQRKEAIEYPKSEPRTHEFVTSMRLKQEARIRGDR